LVTVLDLDGATLRVAQAVNGTSVRRVATTPLDLPAEADRNDAVAMGAAVSKALAKLGLNASSVVMGVPRGRVVLRSLRTPEVEKLSELASLVHLQIAKDLPFRLDEAVIDFNVGRRIPAPEIQSEPVAKSAAGSEPAPTGPRLEVLVAAVQRDVVEFYRKLAESAGLKLLALGLLPCANSRCVDGCQIAEGDAAFALVSLRPDEVSIDVIAQQTLLFSRGATVRPGGAGADGSEAPPATAQTFVPAAVIEVVRSLHSYGGMEPNWPASKVVVAGATGYEAGVAEALGARLAVPCSQLDLASALSLPSESREAAAGSMGAIGLALGYGDPDGLPFDFLDPKRPAAPRNMKRIRLLAGVAGAAVLLVAALGLRSVLIGKRQRALDQIRAELADAEKKSTAYRKVISQSTVVDNWVKGGRDWLGHYAYLASVLPPSEEVYVTSISVAGQGVIRLAVQARGAETLARVEKQLRAAGYEMKAPAITPGADRFGYEFRSTIEIVVPDKLKFDLKKQQPPARPADDASLDPKAWKRGGG
jgi:Tfp pilus assembly PilM family ATPase